MNFKGASMKQTIRFMINCAVLCASATVFGYANPIEGGATETVTNSWTVPVPWMMVGSNSGSNTLVVTEGGQVVNGIGYLGNTIHSSGNRARITGAGSVWSNANELSVGHQGADNVLEIANGGRVVARTNYIGHSSSGNQVRIADAGSVLEAETLQVGHMGGGNELQVSNGGRAESQNAALGYWIGADNNTATVAGNGSVWTNSGTLNVGEYGSGNQLVIEDGGLVASAGVNIGANTLSTNNRVSIQNGGTLATKNLAIGAGNQLDLNDGGAFAINNDFNASMGGFNFNEGGTLEVGGRLTGQQYKIEDRKTIILNGSNAVWNLGNLQVSVGDGHSDSTLKVVNGGLVKNGSGFVGMYGGDNNLVEIGGKGSLWSNSQYVLVGDSGDSNRVSVLDGGIVKTTYTYIGQQGSSSGNSIEIIGADSKWDSSGAFVVGIEGSGNFASIKDGGELASHGGAIGSWADGTRNRIEVSGEGSVWTNSGSLVVGEKGSQNVLSITAGGAVWNEAGTIGSYYGSVSNSVVVSGNGSSWQNEEGLYLGVRKAGSTWYNGGQGNSLTVEDGAKVLVGNVDESQVLPYIGNESAIAVGGSDGSGEMVVGNGSFVNTGYGIIGSATDERGSVVVTGSGTVWSNRDDMYVGYAGSGSELTISDGGQVNNRYSAYIGHWSTASTNALTVSGTSSVMSNGLNTYVGYEGSGNSMVISDGGKVESLGGYIGYASGADGNIVDVTGLGSVWTNRGDLSVGWYGAENELRLADGAKVESGYAHIGFGDSSSNNVVSVSGKGTELITSLKLSVGYQGASNALHLSNGGKASSRKVYIGFDGDNNAAIVSGMGSRWEIGEELAVGLQGSGNYLSVNSGGVVVSQSGVIGRDDVSNGNEAVVSGAGSLWHNREALYLGMSKGGGTNYYEGGTANSLTVSNGGWVFVGDVDTNNMRYVNSSGGVAVGDSTGMAEMVVANQSIVTSGGSVIGLGTNDTGSVLVTGQGTEWNLTGSLPTLPPSPGALYVGHHGSSNRLTIADGAKVESGTHWANPSVIGNAAVSTGNVVVVSGEGSTWDMAPDPDYSLPPLNPGLPPVVPFESVISVQTNIRLSVIDEFAVGNSGSGNQLIIEDGGFVRARKTSIGRNTTANSNLVVVTGEGSTFHNKEALYLGGVESGDEWFDGGSGNTLSIQDGGYVHVGDDSVSSFNSFSRLFVGSTSSVPDMVVGNGSRVEVDGMAHIGYSTNQSGRMTVTGADSVLLTTYQTEVGGEGSGNRLEILDGGTVISKTGTVGAQATAETNSVLVSGDGSRWLNDGDFKVGGAGSGNSLAIAGGGLVLNERGFVGKNSGARGNAVSVTGAGSAWSNTVGLAIGEHGDGNSLTVADGATVFGSGVTVGSYSAASNNAITVTGNGSQLVSSFGLNIGHNGDGSQMTVSDGGLVVNSGYGYLGFDASDDNLVEITGAGSTWSNKSNLIVGRNGSGNRIEVSDGGAVYSEYGYVGGGEGSESNSVTVSDAGSTWEMSDNLSVGLYGTGNSLLIEDGGQVFDAHGTIGNELGSDNNIATVTGVGSVWSNRFNLNVGGFGVNNRLEVADGGKVISSVTTVGELAGSENNSVLVEGAGSELIGSTAIFVGLGAADNMMAVANAGLAESADAYIGYDKTASGNSATVSGYSTWDNAGEMFVGYNGSGNSLRIDDSGHVYSWGGATIGHGATAHSNSVVVSGSGSYWNTGNPYHMVARMYPATNLPPVVINSDQGGVISGSGNLTVGGGSGSVLVGGSGQMVVNPGFVGIDPSSTNNLVAVGGVGSVWQGSTNLTIGTITNQLVLYPGNFLTTTNQLFMPSYADLVVGGDGSFNTLDIEGGGIVASGDGFIGAGSNAMFNSVSVSGAGSKWELYGNLGIGGRVENGAWMAGGVGNSLNVADGGRVNVRQDMHNRNHSSVNVEPGAQINVGGDYYQDAASTLRFGVETNAAGAPLSAMVSVGGTAEFEKDTKIEMASNVGQLHFDTFYTNKIIEADKLIVAGIENPDPLDLEQLDLSGTLVDVVFSENDADIVGIVGRNYINETAGFDTNSMMGKLAKEIDDLSLLGHTNANNMVNLLNTMSGSQQNAQMVQMYTRATPNYLHSRSMTEGMGEIKKHTERYQAPGNTPDGARGIYNKDQELQAWIKPYGAWADRDAQGGYAGYNHNVYGTIVGLDKPVDTALLGLAGGYGRSVISQDDGDSSEAKTGYGVVYLNWGTESWFTDANLGFGRSKVEQDSGTDFGNESDFHANNFATYIGGGKEIRLNRCWTFVPKASVLWSYYYQEGFTDESTMGVERVVEPYERNSLLSSLGGKVTWQKEYDTVVWKPEARLYWLHEFLAEDDRVDYTLNGGMGGEYSFMMPAPEQDVLEAGLGISALLNDDMQLVFDVDGRVGEDYSAYAISGRAIFMF